MSSSLPSCGAGDVSPSRWSTPSPGTPESRRRTWRGARHSLPVDGPWLRASAQRVSGCPQIPRPTKRSHRTETQSHAGSSRRPDNPASPGRTTGVGIDRKKLPRCGTRRVGATRHVPCPCPCHPTKPCARGPALGLLAQGTHPAHRWSRPRWAVDLQALLAAARLPPASSDLRGGQRLAWNASTTALGIRPRSETS